MQNAKKFVAALCQAALANDSAINVCVDQSGIRIELPECESEFSVRDAIDRISLCDKEGAEFDSIKLDETDERLLALATDYVFDAQ